MFQIRFTFTNGLISNLSEIERLYGRLEGMKIPQPLLSDLENFNLSRLEETANYFKILKSLGQKIDLPLDTRRILEIHRELFADESQSSSEVLGKTVFVEHHSPFHRNPQMEQSLWELVDWVETGDILPMIKAGVFHHRFMSLHPFEYGDSQVCRLVTVSILLKHGYLANKYFIPDDYYEADRENYTAKLDKTNMGDETEWLEYFTAGVKSSLQKALAWAEAGLPGLNFSLRPSPREREVLDFVRGGRQINSGDLCRKLNISRQQAFNLLKSLTKKGLLEKKGRTKNSYYFLK